MQFLKEGKGMGEKQKEQERAKEKKEATIMLKKDTIYSVEELAKAAQSLFGVKPECVTAAFFYAGKKEATEEEAKNVVTSFLRKEVR